VRFHVKSSVEVESELTPNLIFPNSRDPSLAKATFPLANGADFHFTVPIEDGGELQLTFQFPEVRPTPWSDKLKSFVRHGRTEISLRASGPFDQKTEFEVAIVNPFRIELQARKHHERCHVRCADGTSGSPCVVCEKNGRSVRFCC